MLSRLTASCYIAFRYLMHRLVMRRLFLPTALGALLVFVVPTANARENVDGQLPGLEPMASPHPGLSEAAHIMGTPTLDHLTMPSDEELSAGLPPCMRLAIRTMSLIAPFPIAFHSATPLPQRFAYLAPREVSAIDRSGALLDQESASVYEDSAPSTLTRVVQVFRDTPIARATLRYQLAPNTPTDGLAPFLLLDEAETSADELQVDANSEARLEVRPVWGSVRGALLRVVF